MDLNRCCVIDIESNGLLSSSLDYSSFPYKLNSDAKLWCVVVTNVATLESDVAVKSEITKEWMESVMSKYDYIIAHNGVKFDFVYLRLASLFDYSIADLGEKDSSMLFGRKVVFIDTLIWSRLFYPDRYGGHSLDAWGERLKVPKTDFRAVCIEKGYMSSDAPKGFEFTFFCPEMVDYCIQDTVTNAAVFKELLPEFLSHKGWKKPSRMEHKLADLAIRRETLGFGFNKEMAVSLVRDLEEKMEVLRNSVEPKLPLKKMNKTEIKEYNPPAKPFKKDGSPAATLIKFAEKHGGTLDLDENGWHFEYLGEKMYFPRTEPIQTHTKATIKDLDHIKMYLIYLGWVPTEWRERDLTKDSKKQSLSLEKRVEALDRWWNDTIVGKKYRNERLAFFEEFDDLDSIYNSLKDRLSENWPVRVPTSPSVRVGVEKDLCPNLTKLGDKVAFASDFALYLTYKHRKSSIAGGEIEDMDFDEEVPNSGYLSMYREQDGRIPTPAIEIGASTSRYKHIGVNFK